MSNYKFIDTILAYEIRNIVIPSMFPSLNSHHAGILNKYLIRLINIIAILFIFSENYVKQLKQNNYQDIKWLLIHLLPYLNENNDLNKINSFEEIFMKTTSTNFDEDVDPKFIYSNVQYNRCSRGENIKLFQFNEKILEQNFYLIL